ncbi:MULTISPECIES: NAD(P)H-dependent glycerol-3-phosphate dehydrogenase [unclassified Polaribacter]|jgi:glycerol-3-phosphate dehydrogenase (NAD(P)+)|uniref:NAD(P)H-dependent glycerol-3-phosphate dehydrogenase n=1 Tax=unclassified Polaribacter TaxID=196858 RepID=UPI00052C23D3|nr:MULTISPECIES: NAD(P)H-dependent glycerol-3-phosphate dehydrogenase [unclassified Polaribacter]KGL60334.1 glycerol-3-phosphate dehydrogenase (NAD(P)+) [Polaribacter sp. Hel1_33_49]MBT3742539.1 NAD(P)H-dependent glycerol-3-phosphate dehydrogenase [Polaribacter sp.]MBT4413643.1 NAD(P)H-dependent glycerol-3-phosphate dehydrogenase [Polaribacter sp.]MBT7816327.1 NAD(P)H-dependent glycerol-3-phosphate dehydrogenase [Polaribacter sp.]MDG1196170.1 NAD(P)H-dependent glycerol-3-phosphate dehydrogenas
MKLKVGLLGGGSWGTTVASLTAKNSSTIIWARNPKTVEEINEYHTNEKYLPNAKLTTSLKASNSIKETVEEADVIVMGVPAQSFRKVLEEAKPHIRPWIPIINLAKGLEISTKMRMTEIIQELMPGHPAGVLTGPNLAREIHFGNAAAAVIAMVDNTIASRLQSVFSSGLFRVYTNSDVIGCELGGALKNIIAIASGMGDGANAGDNTRAAIITRGLSELTRLGTAMGGKERTFAGLAGMGDLVATCSSAKSRNHHVGFQLGRGKNLEEIINEMSEVAEGVKTAKIIMELAKEYNVDMPISKEIYKVLYEGNTVNEAFRGLLKYEIGSEKEPG